MESIPLTFTHEHRSDRSLYKLWKLTNDVLCILCSKVPTTERLNNRSWRLLNQRVLRQHHYSNVSIDSIQKYNGNNKNNNKNKTDTGSRSSSTTSSTSSGAATAYVDITASLQDAELNELLKEKLTNLKPQQSQFIMNRPSLFTHSSNFAQYQASRKEASIEEKKIEQYNYSHTEIHHDDDMEEDSSNREYFDEEAGLLSDISDISDDSDYEECEYEVSRQHTQTQTFSQEPTELQPENTLENNARTMDGTTQKQSGLNTEFNEKDTGLMQSQISSTKQHTSINREHESLFSTGNKSNKSTQSSLQSIKNGSVHGQISCDNSKDDDEGYLSTDISEDEESSNDEEEEEEEEERGEEPQQLEDKQGTMETKVNDEMDPKLLVRDEEPSSNNVKDDNESEWMSISSSSVASSAISGNGDGVVARAARDESLQFTKVQLPPASTSSMETISSSSDHIQVPNTMPALPKPRSLLSGLFLNELAHQSAESSAGASTNASTKATTKPLTKPVAKPILKRSSTTGVTTIDQENQRPSILFNRKFPSFTDVAKLSKRASTVGALPQAQAQAQAQPQPLTTTTTTTIAPTTISATGTNSSLSSPSLHAPTMASLSELQDDDEITPSKKQASVVGISDISVSKVPKAPEITDEEHEKFSSSLNRLSRSVSHHSLMALLSKSTISFTRLYSAPQKLKLHARPLEHKIPESSKYGNVAFSTGSGNGNGNGSEKGNDSINGSDNGILDKQDVKRNQMAEPEHDHNNGNSHIRAQNHKQSPSSLASSSSILISSSKFSNTPPPPIAPTQMQNTSIPEPKPESNIESRSVSRLEKDLFQTEDLSQSLKEALIIDDKLGKVAMPDRRLIKNYKPQVRIGIAGDDDFDDYHAKGW